MFDSSYEIQEVPDEIVWLVVIKIKRSEVTVRKYLKMWKFKYNAIFPCMASWCILCIRYMIFFSLLSIVWVFYVMI